MPLALCPWPKMPFVFIFLLLPILLCRGKLLFKFQNPKKGTSFVKLSLFPSKSWYTMLLISSAVCSLPLLYLLFCFAIYLSTKLSVLLDCELLQGRGPDSRALTQSKQSNVSGMDKLAARALRHIIRPL